MKAVIFHGLGGDSKENWFPWLKSELEKRGFEVLLPDLPNSLYPKQKDWLKTAFDLTDYDENTILIGHSLGAILIMRLLEKIKVKVAFLVAGFNNYLHIDQIKNFFDKEFDYETIKSNKLYMLSSDNDPYIPMETTKDIQKKLDCPMILFEGMDHLSNGTGDKKFPELLEMIIDESS